jgi:hypothetical protein
MHAAASNLYTRTQQKGAQVGELFASWHRKAYATVHVTQADNLVRGFSAAVDGVDVASPSFRIAPPATAFVTRAMGRTCLRGSSRGAREAPPIASTCYVCVVAWELRKFSLVDLCKRQCFHLPCL